MKLDDIDLRDICTAPTVPPREDGTENLDNEDTIFFADEQAALKKIRFFEFARNVVDNYLVQWRTGNPQSIKQVIQSLRDGDISVNTIDFDMANERVQINRNESLSILFGKIAKWFNDFKSGAWLPVINNLTTTEAGQGSLDASQGKILDGKISTLNGNVNATNDTVSSLSSSVNAFKGKSLIDNLTTTSAGVGALDARQGNALNTEVNKLNNFKNKNIANNLTTTSEGYVLDARQGKALNDEINKLNNFKNKGIANNLTTSAEGYVLDARQGRELKGLIDSANNNLLSILEYAYLKLPSSNAFTPSRSTSWQVVTNTTIAIKGSTFFERRNTMGGSVPGIGFKKAVQYLMFVQHRCAPNTSSSVGFDESKYHYVTLARGNASSVGTQTLTDCASTGRGRGGDDVCTFSFYTPPSDALAPSQTYAMVYQREDGGAVDLRLAKIVLLPLGY